MSVFDRLAVVKESQTTTESHAPSDLWLDPAQVIATMAKDMDPIPTGWAPLDNRCRRGGVPPGRVLCFGGPPFAGKTTIVAQIAYHMSLTIPVFALFSDEGRTQASARLGVMAGIPLEEIEEHPAQAAEKLATHLEATGRRLYLLKPDDELAHAETVFRKASTDIPAGSTALVILDSVQTIPPNANPEEDSERLIYKKLMGYCRAQASEHRLIVLLTSQSNRASYRNRKSEENSHAIASFAGSGSIEYLADLALVLGIPDESSQIVECHTAKNRLRKLRQAPSARFHVRYDEATGQMLEVDEASRDAENMAALQERLRPAKDAIRQFLKDKGKEQSRNQIESKLVGRGISRANLRSALDGLVADQIVTEVEREGKGGGYSYALKYQT